MHCIVLCCIVLHCIVLHCIVLHCIALHCIVLYCIELYCNVLYFEPSRAEMKQAKNTRKNGRALGIEYVLRIVDYATTKAKEIVDMVWREDRTLGKWKKGLILRLLQKSNLKKFKKCRGFTLLWRGILDKIVIRSCAVRHCIVLHGYVPGDTISYSMCCLIVMEIPLCRTTCCYILPDYAIS